MTTGHRARGALAVVALSVLLCVSLGGLAHASSYRHRLFRLINHARSNHDVRTVRLNVRLSRDALAHTRKMVRRNRLFDIRNLGEVLDSYSGYRKIGAEVVGCGTTLVRLHRALMSDPAHRKVVLNRKARRVGVGVLRARGKSLCGRNAFWATEIYYG